ncbi:phage portal protein [Rhizobium rhizogenes]|uniref:phage portal protein n=1 Tax=Rhizobium rhizogenes TaxID=359 RepID=UPI001574E740|nr:phage portal protein [Rhizobium rhizogenes]NTF48509.1 phage portal protein [Rhizobium rhizogenes]NTH05894.1 phage portal protein [Rhizobium rhizogenes]
MGIKDNIMGLFGKSEKREAVGVSDPAIARVLGLPTPIDRASKLATASRAISLISGAYASSDVTLFTTKSGSPVPNAAHPLHDVIMNGTAELSAYELKYALMSDLVQHGEAYAHVEFDQHGKLTNLTPLSWNNMNVEFLGNGRIVYRWSDPLRNFNQTVFSQSEILHVKHRPLNGRGRSPIQLAALSMGIAVDVETATAANARRGFSAGGLLSAPGAIGDDTAARLKKSLEDDYSGPDAAGKIIVAGDGLQLTQFSLSNRDAELIEHRKFNAYTVAQAYGLPPESLGIVFSSSWGSAQASNQQLVSHGLEHWSQLLNQSIVAFVMSQRERRQNYLASDFSAYTRGTLQDVAAAYSSLTSSGVMTANEARGVFDLPAKSGGDQLRVPLNTAAIAASNQATGAIA